MTLPYAEPLTLIDPADLVVPEPPRRGEEGGEPCFPCSADSDANLIWSDAALDPAQPRPDRAARLGVAGLAGALRLLRRHAAPRSASTFAGVCGRVERAVLALGDVGAGPPLPLGRRWRALPRLVRAAAARAARHERPPADGVGGRDACRRPSEQIAEAGRRIAAAMVARWPP